MTPSASATAPPVGGILRERSKIKRLQAAILAENDRIEAKYPALRHRNAIEAGACVTACLGMVAVTLLYLRGSVPWWAALPINAWFAALLNEVEHDLMHHIVFKNRPFAHNALMILAWAFRGNYMNPWNRRRVHLLHHKVSGSKKDVETRMIGLGMSWTVLRTLLLVDTFWVIFLRRRLERDAEGLYDFRDTARNMIPFTWMFIGMWLSLLGLQAFWAAHALLHLQIALPAPLAAYDHFLRIAWVVYLGPNLLRTAALHISSSGNHYYGENLDLLAQNQSLNAWFLWPLQPFCFNFARTHVIHHLVVQQPFYMRQLVAPAVYGLLREQGIPFDDVATFRRRNAHPLRAQS
jgi:fatty acid desaturase